MAYFEGEVPVMTYGNNNNGFGSSWEGLIGLALVAGLFDGGFGFGGGRGGYGNVYAPSPATQADLANGFAQNTLQRGIDDIILGQAQGFANVQQTLCQGFSGVNATVTNGFANLNTNLASFAYNTQSGFNALSRELADCLTSSKKSMLKKVA